MGLLDSFKKSFSSDTSPDQNNPVVQDEPIKDQSVSEPQITDINRSAQSLSDDNSQSSDNTTATDTNPVDVDSQDDKNSQEPINYNQDNNQSDLQVSDMPAEAPEKPTDDENSQKSFKLESTDNNSISDLPANHDDLTSYEVHLNNEDNSQPENLTQEETVSTEHDDAQPAEVSDEAPVSVSEENPILPEAPIVVESEEASAPELPTPEPLTLPEVKDNEFKLPAEQEKEKEQTQNNDQSTSTEGGTPSLAANSSDDLVNDIVKNLPEEISTKTAVALVVSALQNYSDKFNEARYDGKLKEFFEHMLTFRPELEIKDETKNPTFNDNQVVDEKPEEAETLPTNYSPSLSEH